MKLKAYRGLRMLYVCKESESCIGIFYEFINSNNFQPLLDLQ